LTGPLHAGFFAGNGLMRRMTIGAMNASQIIVLATPVFLLLITLMRNSGRCLPTTSRRC
jgi:hypothetical protein